jgi:hypothetical protein
MMENRCGCPKSDYARPGANLRLFHANRECFYFIMPGFSKLIGLP